MTTLTELTEKVIYRLSQVPGVATQVYAEDRIKDMIQRGFDTCFDELWWSDFVRWTSATLDGATGTVTTDLSALSDPLTEWKHLRGVYYEDEQTPLPKLPNTFNPYALSGARPRYITPSGAAASVVKVWPVTSTGDLRLVYRAHPGTFGDDDEIPFDDAVLIYFACWDYMEDDGANPGSTAKFQSLFEQRLKSLKMSDNNQPIELDPRVTEYPTEWYTP